MTKRDDEPIEVTPETYIRAEVDGRMATFQARAGGKVNAFYLIKRPTPTAEQPVVRMNRDTLYGGAVIDTSGGATITMPRMPDDRYASVFLIDHDHYVIDVLRTPGRHEVANGTTKHIIAIPRVQLMDPDDEDEIALVGGLLEKIRIEAGSHDPFISPNWDIESLLALRTEYEKEFVTSAQYPSDWMDVRGKANEDTRHLAVAGAWGLFPEEEAVYINYVGPPDASKCYRATYRTPPNGAFWSITVYGADAVMKGDNVTVSDRTATMNADGTFTVWFGSPETCGDRPNRLDITDGWNFLMRVYRPGREVLDRRYRLPEVEEVTNR